jgi:hypothetical protein
MPRTAVETSRGGPDIQGKAEAPGRQSRILKEGESPIKILEAQLDAVAEKIKKAEAELKQEESLPTSEEQKAKIKALESGLIALKEEEEKLEDQYAEAGFGDILERSVNDENEKQRLAEAHERALRTKMDAKYKTKIATDIAPEVVKAKPDTEEQPTPIAAKTAKEPRSLKLSPKLNKFNWLLGPALALFGYHIVSEVQNPLEHYQGVTKTAQQEIKDTKARAAAERQARLQAETAQPEAPTEAVVEQAPTQTTEQQAAALAAGERVVLDSGVAVQVAPELAPTVNPDKTIKAKQIETQPTEEFDFSQADKSGYRALLDAELRTAEVLDIPALRRTVLGEQLKDFAEQRTQREKNMKTALTILHSGIEGPKVEALKQTLAEYIGRRANLRTAIENLKALDLDGVEKEAQIASLEKDLAKLLEKMDELQENVGNETRETQPN